MLDKGKDIKNAKISISPTRPMQSKVLRLKIMYLELVRW